MAHGDEPGSVDSCLEILPLGRAKLRPKPCVQYHSTLTVTAGSCECAKISRRSAGDIPGPPPPTQAEDPFQRKAFSAWALTSPRL